MTQDAQSDQSREQFRPPVDEQLDRDIEAAMEGIDLKQIMSQPTAGGGGEGRTRIRGVHPGVVHSINLQKGEILVELDGKNQGIAMVDQFDTEPRIGDVIEFFVDRFDEQDGIYKLLKKGAAVTSTEWENVHVGQLLEGNITAMNKGGLEMQIGQMRAFMPSGQVDIVFQKDISAFIGQRAKVAVQKVDRKAKNLIVSRRAVLEAERGELREKLFAELEEGQTRRGTVTSVMDYGAFVDLGGADGLIHVSELSHRRGTKATDVVNVGDLVDVKIVKFDRETGKVGLSLKQLMADPWAGAESKYAVGTSVTGRVARIEGFGAFVEVEEGLEGLLPVSEISWQRVNKVGDVLKVDDIVKLSVISLDPKARKMSLSLRQAGPDPWKTAEEKYPRHSVVPGKVTRTVDFGAFIELEPGLEGLVHISEVANRRIRSASEVVKPGETVDVRVLEVDGEKRRISLSIKQVAEPAPAPEPTPAPAAAAAKKSNKPKNLRGGLESGWFK